MESQNDATEFTQTLVCNPGTPHKHTYNLMVIRKHLVEELQKRTNQTLIKKITNNDSNFVYIM